MNNKKKHEFAKKMKVFRSLSMCLHPEASSSSCSKRIIESHTVQRNSALSEIAYGKRKEVYVMEANIGQLFGDGEFVPKKKGISKSTTFKGFCSTHDRTFFSDIENSGFVGTAEQCFCLYYRAVVKQYYDKLCSGKFLESCLKDIGFLKGYLLKMHLNTINLDKTELKEEIENAKRIYSEQSFDEVRHIVLTFDSPVNVMGCACFGVKNDFDNKVIQKFEDLNTPIKLLSVNYFASQKKGYVLFSWNKEHDGTFLALAEQLKCMSPQSLTDNLIYFLLDHAENIAMSVEWYEGLSENEKNLVNCTCAPDVQSSSPALITGLDLWELTSFDIL